jgi:hypothetical protein
MGITPCKADDKNDLMKEELLTDKEAADFCGLDAKYFRNLRRTGHGPTYVRPSPHATLYRKADLEAWRDSWLTATSTKTRESEQEILK